ncbi:Frag1/DRAM/Sfk1 family-domain-containing protein [Hypoxylon fragiforme]|uniref:Frag1/DRAM/Sfk1 family-domain-containing protein n=1 Tax=Hypoxylon fragiforme TaxID=63214 RepID=UPI0020C68403|nr:Frag1/DRAM/Sfk1 family-domain-containing protein [Hypoxylon fragiforme]KAI2608370.1 Frag1/DRAM/Sfk1 family-domain-containing protein [Hypoxylon fragiforme]
MWRLSYWVFPIISGLMWLATLLGLLLHWIIDTHKIKYSSMQGDQTIAYISDVGAAELKPLFITGCIITTIFLDLSFGSDRLLRHRGRLVPNTSTGEKVLSALTIVFAVIGTIGLTFLSGFDTARYPRLHDVFLLFFIAGYLISAIFICWEYQRLGHKNRQHRVLRISFWIKLIFVIVELLLAIGFVVTNFMGYYNSAAILEWIIAFIFSFYVFSFVVDLYPAIATRNNRSSNSAHQMEETYYATHPSVLPPHQQPQNPQDTRDSEQTLTDGSHHHSGHHGQQKVRTDQRDF